MLASPFSLSLVVEKEERKGKDSPLFPRVSTSCEGTKSGASKAGGERRGESSFESGGGRKKEEDETRFDRRVTGDFALRG